MQEPAACQLAGEVFQRRVRTKLQGKFERFQLVVGQADRLSSHLDRHVFSGEKVFRFALHLVDERGQFRSVAVHVELACGDQPHGEWTGSFLARLVRGQRRAPTQPAGDAQIMEEMPKLLLACRPRSRGLE